MNTETQERYDKQVRERKEAEKELEEIEKLTPLDKKVTQVYEAEEWVLACMFDDNNCLYRALDFLNKDDFSNNDHRTIFETCVALKADGIPVDLSTVCQRLTGQQRKLSYFIKDHYPTTETFEHWLRYVKRFSLEQRLRKEIEEPDISLERVDSIVSEIMLINQTKPLYLPISQIEDLKEDPATLIGTGLIDVDRFLVFRPKNVLVIAGRKGEGKTSFGLGMLHFMSQKYPVAVISLEMTAEEIKARVCQAFPLILKKNFFVADPPTLSTNGLFHLCKRLRDREGVKLFMLDYLQLMRETSKFQSRHLEVSHMIRRIKEIAKELDVGIAIISTLARGTDDTARPTLSMLKESGDIEYAADSILFIWSPSEDDKENFVSENVKVIIIDRQRHGVSYKDINVFWIDKLTRFANYDAQHDEVNGKARAYVD